MLWDTSSVRSSGVSGLSYTLAQAAQPALIRPCIVSQQHWPTDQPSWSEAICRPSLRPSRWTWWLSLMPSRVYALHSELCATSMGMQSASQPLLWHWSTSTLLKDTACRCMFVITASLFTIDTSFFVDNLKLMSNIDFFYHPNIITEHQLHLVNELIFSTISFICHKQHFI